jgi:glutathione synthase/RimK-type ligase-like ATP-grasp enzyme
MKFALATAPDMPHLYEDDQLFQRALIARGHEAPAVVWDDTTVDWSAYDAIVIRSTWGYHERLPEFIQWLDHLKQLKAKVWNPVKLMKWNADKRYLLDLEDKGVPIVPTFWIYPEEQPPYLDAILETQGWLEAVVKPAISGGAYLTERFSMENAAEKQDTLHQILQTGPAMVQPYLAEIETDGEYSFIYFGGEYHFTIQKRPKSGDFRVQLEFGGSIDVINPGPELIEQANKVMRSLEYPTLYARVDGVIVDGRFLLMELELIEPYLSLEHYPGSADKMADVVISYLNE